MGIGDDSAGLGETLGTAEVNVSEGDGSGVGPGGGSGVQAPSITTAAEDSQRTAAARRRIAIAAPLRNLTRSPPYSQNQLFSAEVRLIHSLNTYEVKTVHNRTGVGVRTPGGSGAWSRAAIPSALSRADSGGPACPAGG